MPRPVEKTTGERLDALTVQLEKMAAAVLEIAVARKAEKGGD